MSIKTVLPVDSDVPSKALPMGEPEGVTFLDGTFLEYDQTMEVYRSMQVVLSDIGKDPSLLGLKDPKPPEEIGNHGWVCCYLWAMTVPSREDKGLTDMKPVEFLRRVHRRDMKKYTLEMVRFIKEMNPDPNDLRET